MTAQQWFSTLQELHAPVEAQYARCLKTEKVFGLDSRQARTEYAKLAGMYTSIAVQHYKIWLDDYLNSMIDLVPRIGKQAVLSNIATLELSCSEWQSDLIVNCRNQIALVRTEDDSILRVQVSIFRDHNPSNPVSIELLKFLKSRKYAPQVDKIRSTGDKKARDAMKFNLPCITPSAVLSYRSEVSLIAHSGFVQFDLDERENPAYFAGLTSLEEIIALCESIRAELAKCPYIAYVGLSVSARGLWGLIPISDPSEYKEHLASIQLMFANMGFIIDKAPSNVASPRAYSYDVNAYFNHSAKRYTDKVYPVKHQVKEYASINQDGHSEASKVSSIVKAICNRAIDLTSDYFNWVKIAYSLASEFGESGRGFFHDVSQFHPKYHPTKVDKQYDYCLRRKSKNTIATFYMIAAEHGVGLKNVTA